MWLDDPGLNQTLAWPLQIRGWAIDTGAPSGIGVDAVHIYAYPGRIRRAAGLPWRSPFHIIPGPTLAQCSETDSRSPASF